jgi:NADH-quinone oxidoreductase subunit A
VIFDVEVLFLYPWVYVYANEAMQKLMAFGSMNIAVFEMLLFIIVLLVGLIYAIKKEALRWV